MSFLTGQTQIVLNNTENKIIILLFLFLTIYFHVPQIYSSLKLYKKYNFLPNTPLNSPTNEFLMHPLLTSHCAVDYYMLSSICICFTNNNFFSPY